MYTHLARCVTATTAIALISRRAHSACMAGLCLLLATPLLSLAQPVTSPTTATTSVSPATSASTITPTTSVPGNWFDTSIWDNPERDYKWYPPDPAKPAFAKPPKAVPVPVAPPKEPIKATPKAEPEPVAKPKVFKDLKSTKEIHTELERLKEKAVMSKSEPDVLAYLQFQNEVMNASAEYADVFRRVVWSNPEIDYQQRRPTNSSATLAYDTQRRGAERANIAELAKEHGLFFFFRSDCPYCHQMAPMLRAFGQQTGMNILPISLDGGGLPDFAQPKTDNGLAQELGVKMVPALYLVSKTSRAIQAVSYGVVAQSDLLERIYVLTQTKPGQSF
jgi:conjugal transfer pilus assembly protein TraF